MTSFEKLVIYQMASLFGGLVGGINETLRKQVAFLLYSSYLICFLCLSFFRDLPALYPFSPIQITKF